MSNFLDGHSEVALRSFNEDGFVVLPNFLPPLVLHQLRELFDELISDVNSIETVSHSLNGKNYVTNIEKLCPKGNLSCLELLGSPLILEIARSICGDDFFLIQEFAVIKMLGDNTPVLWHQDMQHQRTGKCFTMGIYLDDANAGDGALYIVPKSHTSGKDICLLKDEPFIEVPMKAGGILIHDMMLAHSSGIMHQNLIRRVLYFEFLTVKQVIEENIYSIELINNRLRLLRTAIAYYRQQHPLEKKFEWDTPLSISSEESDSIQYILNDIYKTEVHAKPSAYCFEHAGK